MRLKSLEMHGFKSFADKTKLEFHEGVTGIVGPNGCGKSNIVDSMRWVLGETSAKALRGGEMADVIFNGTDRRQPLGMAEVTLTLSGCEGILDTEYDEVSLGRRVFRDGKGEYLINKQPCRLKDIHNLLMDTGIGRTSYSIMEQGKIDMLLSSKPEDRRAVFEEAAGITKYKSQKKEAIRKLDYTEANLVRIRDVIAENERQIRSLSRQASKAKRYQSLFDDVKTLELHLNHKQWRELIAEKSEMNTSINALRLQQDEMEDKIEKRQAEMASARVEYQEIENRLTALRSQLARLEGEIAGANNRIEFNGERTHEHSLLIKKNEAIIVEAIEKRDRQQTDIEAANRHLSEVEERISSEEEKVKQLESDTLSAREQRETLNGRMRELEEERSKQKSRIASLEATLETNRKQLSSDEQRERQLSDETGRLQESEIDRKKDSNELRERITGHQKSIEEFEENLSELDQKYHRAKRAASDMQENLSSLHKLHAEKRSRLEVLEQLIADGEGFEKGTRAVVQELSESESYRGKIDAPLSRHLRVDANYAEAIEAALGRRLQAVIVSELDTVEQLVGTLRDDKLGQASLLARTALEGAPVSPPRRAPLGAIGWAVDLVSCEKNINSVMSRLLEGVLVAEDLATAMRLHKKHPDFSIATIDGTFITAEGIVQGGRSGDDSVSILKMQSEIEELKEVCDALKQEVTSRQERRDELNNRVDSFEEALQDARERLQQKKVASSTLEGKLALVERDLNQLRNKIETLEWESRDLTERKEKVTSDLQRNEEERVAAQTRVEELDKESDSIVQNLTDAREREEKLTEEVTEARTSLAVEQGTRRNLQEQIEPMVARLAELDGQIETSRTEIESYRERIENAQIENEGLQESIAAWQSESVVASEERDRIQVDRESFSERIEEGESELTRVRNEVQVVAKQRGKEEVQIAQIDIKIENIERVCRDRYRTELEFFEPDSHALLMAIEERKKNGATRSAQIPSPEPSTREDSSARDGEADENADAIPDPSEPDWEFVEDVVTTLRTKLDSMGPVNIDAIEEFDELEEHYRFNVQQLEDLENSKEELLRMIARINRDTRKMFTETFEKIRKNFRDMFKELFGEKAKSDLILMDDGDPLECGIDVIAKPPGKKLQSISLLSGGERSMTAVALLFGIYMVKPSPFCVLDELDAPLDEANITRFIRVLDRFIGDSQFVIVTHSKRTMSRADVMYGVSMEEFGVSKTVGVTFSKADEAKGLKTAAVGG
ncbi:MAG: chromosome segregation protein SMC [Verrucomicrobiales bacterium]|nr:chromosome segregation protein SMC [Verrucomicrobiales bacterium]